MTPTVDALLGQYGRFGISLGLDTSYALLERLAHPEKKVPIVHVAGTNGKGSVCAYLRAILTEAGYRVGCYTSPHLVSWTERITLNQAPVDPTDLALLLEEVIQVADTLPQAPSQFEIITAAAWLYFAREKVDIAVIEVGLGGRLDATNVCPNPLVTVITSIGRDHWQRLGDSLEAIATEKAGILKPHCPVVISPMDANVIQVIQNRAEVLNCPLYCPEPVALISNDCSTQAWGRWRNYEFPLPLAGDIQLANAALALMTVDLLVQQGWSISPTAVTQGMQQTRWPGRLQWTTWRNTQILLDGAHNEPAAQSLRNYLAQNQLNPVTWMIGILATKDAAAILRILLRPGDQLHLVPIVGHEHLPLTELSRLARTICPGLEVLQSHPDLITALTQVTQSTTRPKTLVITGSLYLIGEFCRLSLPQDTDQK